MIDYDWSKNDQKKDSRYSLGHPFICFNGAYLIFKKDPNKLIEDSSRDVAFANAIMKTDYPFILRVSGFSGNLNGISCLRRHRAIINKQLKHAISKTT